MIKPPVPKRLIRETDRRWQTKTRMMAALYALHKEFYAVKGFTLTQICKKVTDMGKPLQPSSSYTMPLMKELWREGEVEGFQAVWRTNADGTELVAYYWYLAGMEPATQMSMFPDVEL